MDIPTIITNQTRELFHKTDEVLAGNPELHQPAISELVTHLGQQCLLPEIREKYETYSVAGQNLTHYPLSSDGYAKSFDVLTEEAQLYEHWSRLGVVVSKQVVSAELCGGAIDRVGQIVSVLSEGSCDINNPDTYANLPVDDQGVPILTRGFFEIYHDNSLAQIRQSLRTYLHHVVLWGRADLWTTFDRYGVKLTGHVESVALPLHVDQNPKEHPDFKTVQGVLALDDCPVERGTLVAVPGSKSLFEGYLPMAPKRGEYVELDTADPLAETLQSYAQPIPLRRGDLVSWDSRTTHANTANISPITRYIALIAAGPAQEHNHTAVSARADGFTTGLGSNVREALMHASKKPRYTNPEAVNTVRIAEELNPLGKLLYGQDSYRGF